MTIETKNPDVKNQYELLNILDGKASALLTFNAIFMAIVSIKFDVGQRANINSMYALTFFGLAVSCLLILQVIRLRWVKLEDVKNEPVAHLERTRKKRTLFYRCAWYIAAACIVLVGCVQIYGL